MRESDETLNRTHQETEQMSAHTEIRRRTLAIVSLLAVVLAAGLIVGSANAAVPVASPGTTNANNISDTHVTLRSQLSTDATLSDCHFEWVNAVETKGDFSFADLSSGGSVDCDSLDGAPIDGIGDVPADAADHLVGATIALSEPNEPIYYRLVAQNPSGTAVSLPQSVGFGITTFDGSATDSIGSTATQAGSHPADARTEFSAMFAMLKTVTGGPANGISQDIKDVEVNLPAGFAGNVQDIPTCTAAELATGTSGACPINSQIGVVSVGTAVGSTFGVPASYTYVPLYNMEHGYGTPALFGYNVAGSLLTLDAGVRTGDDYGITISGRNTPLAVKLWGAKVDVWGVPADPIHDVDRGDNASGCPSPTVNCANASTAPRVPLLTLPTSCVGPVETTIEANTWSRPDVIKTNSFFSHDNATPTPNPIGNTGCENVPFDPDVDVAPTTQRADSPSGFDFNLEVPQDGLLDPDGIATAHLKKAVVHMPEGMAVNPSSAGGLGSCSPVEIGLDSADAATCPDDSKIGTVEIDTPLLDHPISGGVYLAEQSSFQDQLIALYIAADDKESGVVLKLPGIVEPDPETGRLVATFDDQPQLPFSNLSLHLKSGSRAPLVTPSACGSHDIVTELTPWARPDEVVTQTSSFTIDRAADGGPCGPAGFAPLFVAGVSNAVAGAFSPFSLSVARSDGDQELRSLRSIRLPEGLLGKVSSVPLCDGAAADAGSCPEGSRVGRVLVAAGAGASPLWVPQAGKSPTSVSLTGPYRGAPYGLSIVVPAQAGPFDLGKVVVRSALRVDERTAQLSTGIDQARVYGPDGQLERVLEGEMPTILEGIPLKVRELRVVVDRDGFVVNPTDCSEQRVTAEAVSVSGATAGLANRFQVGDCARLGFRPKLAMRLIGKGRTRTGTHPGLKTILTQPSGQANIAKAQVTLPKSVVLDPRNSTDPALVCDYDKAQAADCPASSIIGRATARTPLLRGPLSGNVHLVQGIRFGPTGNRIRTTPSLLVKLRGEVSINLYARTTVKNNRLVTIFDQVPDARVSRFDLHINGGRKGILVITRTARSNINICRTKQTAAIKTSGQNGRQANYNTNIKTPCAKKAKKAKRKTNKKK